MLFWCLSTALLILGVWFLYSEMKVYAGTSYRRVFQNPAVLSKVLGLSAGLLIRLAVSIPPLTYFFVEMSVGFLFLTPFVIGFVSMSTLPIEERVSFSRQCLAPWLPSITALLLAGCFGFEGAICLLMALPVWLALASLGGICGVHYRRSVPQPLGAYGAVVLFLPFAVSAWESRLPLPEGILSTTSEIRIAATSEAVWREIVSVPAIRDRERSRSFAELVGFPAPVAATLNGVGLGAVRRATFRGGLEFLETITEWQPGEVIAFDIRANSADIPATTLDPHVTIGGEFFDVLRGRYRIEELPGANVRLILTSQHKLTTRFNWYSEIWVRLIMGSIQRQILEVIKARAESQPMMDPVIVVQRDSVAAQFPFVSLPCPS